MSVSFLSHFFTFTSFTLMLLVNRNTTIIYKVLNACAILRHVLSARGLLFVVKSNMPSTCLKTLKNHISSRSWGLKNVVKHFIHVLFSQKPLGASVVLVGVFLVWTKSIIFPFKFTFLFPFSLTNHMNILCICFLFCRIHIILTHV